MAGVIGKLSERAVFLLFLSLPVTDALPHSPSSPEARCGPRTWAHWRVKGGGRGSWAGGSLGNSAVRNAAGGVAGSPQRQAVCSALR